MGGRVFVVDVGSREVVGEVDMVDEAGEPLVALHNTYASYDGRYVYVTAILSDTIARIDPTTNTIDRRYVLSGQPRPAAITHDDDMAKRSTVIRRYAADPGTAKRARFTGPSGSPQPREPPSRPFGGSRAAGANCALWIPDPALARDACYECPRDRVEDGQGVLPANRARQG